MGGGMFILLLRSRGLLEILPLVLETAVAAVGIRRVMEMGLWFLMEAPLVLRLVPEESALLFWLSWR